MSAKPKAKDLNPFPQGKKNQDLLQRLNHLYQANTYLASLSRELASSTSEAGPGVTSWTKDRRAKKGGQGEDGRRDNITDALGVVVRRSNHRFRVMAKHNILSTDPALKRSFCKSCNSICIPGLNARVRVRASKIHGNKIITTCLTCSVSRTIPAAPIQGDIPAQNALAVLDTSNPNSIASSTLDEPHSQVALTIRPTSIPTSDPPNEVSPLDGINRSAKRRKLSKKPQFWRKEAALPAPPTSVETSGAPEKDIERTTKQADKCNTVVNPPVISAPPVLTSEVSRTASLEEEGAHDALLAAQVAPAKTKQLKGQKQKGQKGGKGGIAAAPLVKQDGHLVWRGEELVTGWGDPVSVQAQIAALR
ncbi:hypothetical protein NCC49_001307 [Naganishia albida]|nr:hypothetical protein NCC49_001307 [Naganishia albida]